MTTDFDDLDALLAEAKVDQKKTVRQLNAQVHKELDSLEALLDEATRPKPVWETDAAVVLIHDQLCLSCLTVSSHCIGWFASQKHSTDPHARRMVAGRPIGKFPLRVEHHKQPDVDICANCAESQIRIEEVMNPPCQP